MSIGALSRWFKAIVIVLLVCMLALTFIPSPGRAFADWLLLALGLCTAGVIVLLALKYARKGHGTMRKFLFDERNAAMLWLVVRAYLGSVWLQSGLTKVTGSGWTDGGSMLKGFWFHAVQGPQGGHSPIPYAWYRDLLSFMLAHHVYTWFAWVITISEVTIAVFLILGLCTGLAACAGGVLNLLYLLAGSISVNPIMLILSLLLLQAWRVAGYHGLDRLLFSAFAQKRPASASARRRRFALMFW